MIPCCFDNCLCSVAILRIKMKMVYPEEDERWTVTNLCTVHADELWTKIWPTVAAGRAKYKAEFLPDWFDWVMDHRGRLIYLERS